MVRYMHNTAGFFGKEAEAPVMINTKKYCMFSHLHGPGPQTNHCYIRLFCLFHFYTQADKIDRAAVLNKERMVENAGLMHCA